MAEWQLWMLGYLGALALLVPAALAILYFTWADRREKKKGKGLAWSDGEKKKRRRWGDRRFDP